MGRGNFTKLTQLSELQKKAQGILKGSISNKDKTFFLSELKKEWTNSLTGTSFNIEKQADLAEKRIKKSGLKFLFDQAGVTREDMVEILREIKEKKEE